MHIFSVVSQKCCLVEVMPTMPAVKIFLLPLPQSTLSLEDREWYAENISFMAESPKISQSLHIVQLWVSLLIPVY